MALTRADVYLWSKLVLMQPCPIPTSPSVLEIGEANWFGDIPPPTGMLCSNMEDPFAIAKAYYKQVFDYKRIVSVDLHGTETALKLDLNNPVMLPAYSFDVVINSGTTEHIFNQAQLFKTIHHYTASPAGLMIHAAPVRGFHNHGLYTYSPELFQLIAQVNGYRPLLQFFYDFTNEEVGVDREHCDVMLYVAWQKVNEAPFKMPIQERYETP